VGSETCPTQKQKKQKKNFATRMEKLLYLDDIGDDLPSLVVPVPIHGLQLSHKDREIPFCLEDVGDDLPPLVVPVPSQGLQLCHKDRETPVP
jgi:hypothetical protein